jgi:pyridoxamine 5'-phosphate oxidase-like protein
MPAFWSEEIDTVLGGDLTAALTYLTPAGGAVATAVAPVGLRDREAGWVGFTTSLGFGKKLDRIERDPHVAMAFHAREHGTSYSQRYVLVQGRAEIVPDPDEALRTLVWDQAVRVLGPAKRGRLFWDRWLREYYAVRVPVLVHVDRILTWPDLGCEGGPEVLGAPAPLEPPAPQAPPKGGTGPRLDSAKAASRCRAKRHQLVASRGADGYPVTVPVQVKEGGPHGMRLTAVPGLLPQGGRRAGLLAHSYRPQLIGLATRYHTGWLEADPDGTATYAPHTAAGFVAPPNKTLLLLGNGLVAKLGVRSARKAGRLTELPAGMSPMLDRPRHAK